MVERALAARGVHGDTMIAHISPAEALLLRQAGGVGTRNPRTGLLQFYGDDVGGPGTSDVGGPGNIGGGAGARADAAARNGSGGGGYGNATGDRGSVLGAGGGHSGNNYTAYNPPGPGPMPVPSGPAPVTSNMPPAAPVPTAPMMSTTTTANLTGNRFGSLPAWALTPYQIGTAPISYPTPGVNTSIGDPNAGGAARGPAGGVGSAFPGSGASGAPGSMPAPGTPAATTAGIGVNPLNGQVMQATADRYAPYQLAAMQKLGITPNPVAHQIYENKVAASHGATAGQLAFPVSVQGQPASGTQTPSQVVAARLLGLAPAPAGQGMTPHQAAVGGLGGLNGMQPQASLLMPKPAPAAAPIAPAQTPTQAAVARLLGIAPAPAASVHPAVGGLGGLGGLPVGTLAPKPVTAAPVVAAKPGSKAATAPLLTAKPAAAAKKPVGKTNR